MSGISKTRAATVKKIAGDGKPLRLNQRQLAKALSVSVQTISNWELPFTKIGKEAQYDLAECVNILLARAREKLGSLEQEQTKLAQVRREKLEHELAVQKKEALPLKDVMHLHTEYGLALKAQLESLVERLPTRFAAEHDWRKIKEILKQETGEALKIFQKMTVA